MILEDKNFSEDHNRQVLEDITCHYGRPAFIDKVMAGHTIQYDPDNKIYAIDNRAIVKRHGCWEFLDMKSL